MANENYSGYLDFLYSLEIFGIKFGLKNTLELLSFLENPQHSYKSIHITGTNGKGSTSAFIASILQESGLTVGLYTSPHLINFNERIKINGKEISNVELVEYIALCHDKIIELKATFFEATTCIAFKYFSDNKVDIAVIETGLGGRLDSTNILNPEFTIITDIGIDHTKQLGETIEEITLEKAGILKENKKCITGVKNQKSLKILHDCSIQKNVELVDVNQLFQHEIIGMNLGNMLLEIRENNQEFLKLSSPFIGLHQISNIFCSIKAVKELKVSNEHQIDSNHIKEGIVNVINNTKLHCRIELVHKNPAIILDVAHNFDSIKRLIETLSNFKFKEINLIFGIMKDKDFLHIIQMLSEIVKFGYAVKVGGERALSAEKIVEEFQKSGKNVEKAESIQFAIDNCLNKAAKEDLILITGSHYVCGQALNYLKNEKCLDIF